MIISNGSAYYHDIYQIYSVLPFKFCHVWKFVSVAWNVIIFKNGKVTPNDLHIMKNFAQKTYHYVRITWGPSDINEASDSAFTVIVYCVCHRRQHKPSVALQTYQLPLLAFCSRLIDEWTWCWVSSTCPNSVVLTITRKILSKLLFCITHD